jgi:hypothetical protein
MKEELEVLVVEALVVEVLAVEALGPIIGIIMVWST